jgi:hypothetical protein
MHSWPFRLQVVISYGAMALLLAAVASNFLPAYTRTVDLSHVSLSNARVDYFGQYVRTLSLLLCCAHHCITHPIGHPPSITSASIRRRF